MVFQNYALFPHMTAGENIAFPLKQRRIRGKEQRQRVVAALEMVHLGPLGGRYPRELSGGQQQRVALARAIVFNPRILLMDEPLGALDRKLREALQLEIKRIHRELGITFIYVTHDQEEALVMSDRIAIYNNGAIEQMGSAADLYERPANAFVASFIGESNVFDGTFAGGERFDCGDVEALVSATELVAPGPGALVVRPERIRLFAADHAPPAGWNAVDVVVDDVIYLGNTSKYLVRTASGREITARVQAGDDQHFERGDGARAVWPSTAGHLLSNQPKEDGATQ
jgi:putative spermidine/putrescine transport system ATP-binding protein